jgi:4-amino-4-deoxy-L-arabinose transferase-like glycosyltransferase
MNEPVTDRSRRRSWIAAAAGIIACATLGIWLATTSTGTLREHLRLTQFWSLEVCVFLGLAFGVCIVKDLSRGFQRSDLTRMAGLAAVAVGLTLVVAPRTNRIFYDEQIYQSIGQNLTDLRLAQVCNDGSVEYGRLQCLSGEYNKQPYAYPHLLSLAYRLFGVRAATAFLVNAAVMAATVWAVYLLVWLLFRDRDAAFFAGLVLALTPHQIIWSATAAVEPSASLAAVVALAAAAHYMRVGGTAALGAAVVSAAYAIQFRPESFLVLPVAGVLAWPRLAGELRRPHGWWAGVLFVSLVGVHIAHLFAVRNIEWGASAARFSLDYLPENLRVNGLFYLFDERFPGVFALLALAGLMVSLRGPAREAIREGPGPADRPSVVRRAGVAMALYFGLFFGIDLVFYAGSYNYGADVRYSLMTYPPIAVLAGLGAARLSRVLARTGLPARPLMVTALAFLFLWYAPVVRATTEEAWAARADVRFARELAAGLPLNSYVLTHNPGMFQLWGASAGQLPLIVENPAYVKFLMSRYTGGVFVHWNFWCNVQDPVHPEFCRRAVELGTVELVREYRERDQRFALYRLTLPAASAR